MALDVTQVAADDVVCLDDREMFVEVARAPGLKGIVHTSFETTKAQLAALGLEWRVVSREW